jgi:hypothetical protein
MLGIFDIHMPLLYGEGNNAFRRLQEHILEKFEDYTIFAWEDDENGAIHAELGLLAPSPAVFQRTRGLWKGQYSDLESLTVIGPNRLGVSANALRLHSARLPMTVTSRGIYMQVPVAHRTRRRNSKFKSAIVLCGISNKHLSKESWLCLEIEQLPSTTGVVCRSAEALRAMDNDDIKMLEVEQLYGLGQTQWISDTLSVSLQGTLLCGVVIDVLANFSSVDPVLLSQQKIDSTCHFGCTSCYRKTVQSSRSDCPETLDGPTNQIASDTSNLSQNDDTEDNLGTPEMKGDAASRKDSFYRSKQNIDIHKLEATLANIYQDLSPLFLRLLLCCLLSLIHEPHFKKSFILVAEVVHDLNVCISDCYTIGCFVVRVFDAACNQWFRVEYDTIDTAAATTSRLRLLTRIIGCCEALATDPQDKLGITITQASLRALLSQEPLLNFSNLQPQTTCKTNEMLATYTTATSFMQQLRLLHEHEPPSTPPLDLVDWAVKTATKWSQDIPAQELRLLFHNFHSLWTSGDHQESTLSSSDKVDYCMARLLYHCITRQIDTFSELDDAFLYDLEIHGLDWRPVAKAIHFTTATSLI